MATTRHNSREQSWPKDKAVQSETINENAGWPLYHLIKLYTWTRNYISWAHSKKIILNINIRAMNHPNCCRYPFNHVFETQLSRKCRLTHYKRIYELQKTRTTTWFTHLDDQDPTVKAFWQYLNSQSKIKSYKWLWIQFKKTPETIITTS